MMFMQLRAKLSLEFFEIVCLKASIFSNDLGDVARWGGGPKQIAAKQAHGRTRTNMHTHTHASLSVMLVLLTRLSLGTKAFLAKESDSCQEHH